MTESRAFFRTADIEDMTIRADGGGRTVEAFAIAYGSTTPIHDAEGRYDEIIVPGAAKRSIETRGIQFESSKIGNRKTCQITLSK